MIRPVLVCLLAFAATGISYEQQVNSVTQLDGKVSALDTQVQKLETELRTLRARVSRAEFQANLQKFAALKPSSTAYSIIDTDLGSLTVSLADVQPYADGTKIRLQFGNVTSATFINVSAKIEWGKVDANGLAIEESNKNKTETFTKSFLPGAWNDVEVVLEGLPASSLGYVTVSEVKYDRILLSR